MSLQHNAFQQNAFQIGIFGDSGIIPPPPPVAPAETPAGRRTRRQNYILRLDGQEFVCKSLAEVYRVLDQAKALALKLSQERVRGATEPRASIKPLPVPQISADSPQMQAAVKETQREIERIYRNAALDMEIALWFAVEREQQDEDAITLLWM